MGLLETGQQVALAQYGRELLVPQKPLVPAPPTTLQNPSQLLVEVG